jgi:prepilin peptidase CpaA
VLLAYVGYLDLRTFKIKNTSTLLLLAFYIVYVPFFRSTNEILLNVTLSIMVFSASLYFFHKSWIGGGDVKLLSVACMWVQSQCVLLFAIALLFFVIVHTIALRLGWCRTTSGGGIAYAPSVAAALISMILLGCA